MAKSRQRKDHKKKVAARNINIKAAEKAMQKLMTESMQKELEKMKELYESQSGNTETVKLLDDDMESVQS